MADFFRWDNPLLWIAGLFGIGLLAPKKKIMHPAKRHAPALSYGEIDEVMKGYAPAKYPSPRNREEREVAEQRKRLREIRRVGNPCLMQAGDIVRLIDTPQP